MAAPTGSKCSKTLHRCMLGKMAFLLLGIFVGLLWNLIFAVDNFSETTGKWKMSSPALLSDCLGDVVHV